MKPPILIAYIDTSEYTNSLNTNLKKYLYNILSIIDSLYALQRSDTTLNAVENLLYKEIINSLKSCSEFLSAEGAGKLKDQIHSIEGGIYDVAAIGLETPDGQTIYLVFGKIISSEDSKKYYSAALGIEDMQSCSLIYDYKKEIDVSAARLPLIHRQEIDNILNLNNSFKCMAAFKLAGFINRPHLPFSLFYSGGHKQQITSLSNTILLTNIYVLRYKVVSERIGNELFDPEYTARLPCDLARQILVLWLWGHDMGHFLKGDNLKYNITSQNEYLYEVLHELRSDVFSLYLLKQLCDSFLNAKSELVYKVFVMEMFRYIRRGDFENQPDSVSAYLIYKFMQYNKVLTVDTVSGNIVLNYREFGKIIDELLCLMLDLFKNGTFENVDKFFIMMDIGSDFNRIEDSLELDLAFNNIPGFIKLI